MTAQIKYLEFKGIDKKEQILFKSFLNLAKNELDYQVVILKKDYPSNDEPDMVIVDDRYQFNEDEEKLLDLPTIMIGDDFEREDVGYIARPVQWSDFKVALTELAIGSAEHPEEAERVLPEEVKFAIEKNDSVTELSADADAGNELIEEDDYDYEFELGNMSADYYSFTNSDYMKVAEDVRKFKTDVADEDDEDGVVLMADDESGHDSGVLVLETHSFDAWDYTESEITVTSVSDFDEDDLQTLDHDEPKKFQSKKKKGIEVDEDEEYWHEDNEIIVDQHTLLWIKTKRGMVYSVKPPGNWPAILQRRGLSKLPLRSDWRPDKALIAYPLTSLIWVNTLIRDTSDLHSDLQEDGKYILERWPQFDLLELDNILLKLCTMLFVRPESVQTLGSKSGYGRSTIIGLMNACYEMGLLVTPDKIDISKQIKASNDEGMLGKIRDVFR